MTEYTQEEKAFITKQILRDIISDPDNGLGIRDTFYIENILKKRRGVLAKGDKLYPSDSFYHYLYGSILESEVDCDMKFKEVLMPLLEEALIEHGMTQDDWEEVKTRIMPMKWFKNVVDDYDTHPSQIDLLTDPNINKKDLYAGGTVNKNARNVIRVKKRRAHISSIEERVSRLEETVQELKDLPNRVEKLEQDINEIKNEDYRKIAYMYIKGLTSAEIVQLTGFNKRKVQRGIQEYKRIFF